MSSLLHRGVEGLVDIFQRYNTHIIGYKMSRVGFCDKKIDMLNKKSKNNYKCIFCTFLQTKSPSQWERDRRVCLFVHRRQSLTSLAHCDDTATRGIRGSGINSSNGQRGGIAQLLQHRLQQQKAGSWPGESCPPRATEAPPVRARSCHGGPRFAYCRWWTNKQTRSSYCFLYSFLPSLAGPDIWFGEKCNKYIYSCLWTFC